MLVRTLFLCIAFLSTCSTYSEEKNTLVFWNFGFLKDPYESSPELESSNDSLNNDELRHECIDGKGAPKRLLEQFRDTLVDKCRTVVTLEEAQQHAEYRNFLIKLFSRLKVKDELLPDPSHYLSAFSSVYQKLGKTALNATFEAYEQNFSSYREAIVNFLSEMQHKHKIKYEEPSCLLRARIFESNFNHRKIGALIDQLKILLNNLKTMSRSCGVAIHNGETDKVEKYVEEIDKEVDLITTFAVWWYGDSLKSAWPSIHHQILDEHIIRYKSSSEVDIEKAVVMANKVMDNTGVPNFTHEVIIVNSDKQNRFIYHEIYWKGRCSLNKGPFGFDTIIRRTSFESKTQQKKPGQSNKTEATKKLNNMVRDAMEVLYQGDFSVSDIIETLKSEIGSTIGETRWSWSESSHCFAFVWAWSSKLYDPCPIIEYFTSSSSNSSESINALSYSRAVSLRCQEYRFFYFD